MIKGYQLNDYNKEKKKTGVRVLGTPEALVGFNTFHVIMAGCFACQ